MIEITPNIPRYPYFSKGINEPITLFHGDFRIVQGDITEIGKGTIELSWFPETSIKVSSWIHAKIKFLREDFEVYFDEAGSHTNASFSSLIWISHDLGEKLFEHGFYQTELTGRVKEIILFGSPESAIKRCLFSLPNFFDFDGEFIESNENLEEIVNLYPNFDGGICFVYGKWKVIILSFGESLEAEASLQSFELQEELDSKGGFAITNLGLIERLDGNLFSKEESDSTIKSLRYFLSFVRDSWVSPILLIGFDQQNCQAWESWEIQQVASWKEIPLYVLDKFDCAEGFYKRWHTASWEEPIRTAVHWYVESKNKAGGLEGSIVLIQNALELLAWVYLVEETKFISRNGFSKIPASDQIRLLMSLLTIPIAIPKDCVELIKFFKQNNKGVSGEILNSPQALTEIRNDIVHSNPIKRPNDPKISHAAKLEAWELGCSCLESVLLQLFNPNHSVPLVD
jgi:hypothetical protein